MAASSVKSSTNRYDFVIFGASGFTGQYVVEEVIKKTPSSVTWAVAGRSADKLEQTVKNAFKITGKLATDIPILISDVSDENSLAEMCKKAKVILNCVGPYRFYGEPVVKACIANKAHYVDISGEPQYLERIQLDYHDAAKEAGIYVIGAAGFDSVPIEAGIRFLKDKFSGDINSMASYFTTKSGEKTEIYKIWILQGMSFNYGTWHSAIHGFAHYSELKPLRMKLFPEQLPKRKYKIPVKKTLFYSSDVQSWCLPFLGVDKAVVQRTQYYLYHQKKSRPFQISTYLQLPSLFTALGIMFVAAIFALFASFSLGRKLLEKYPKLFSFGLFSKDGPSREQILATSFTTTIVAFGYKETLAEPSDEHSNPPDMKIVAKVKGPEPAYVTTPICMLQSGLIILQEIEKLPDKGGVYTAGAAFDDTTLLERLSKNGFEFTSESAKEISS